MEAHPFPFIFNVLSNAHDIDLPNIPNVNFGTTCYAYCLFITQLPFFLASTLAPLSSLVGYLLHEQIH
jgi:hypothetical protein